MDMTTAYQTPFKHSYISHKVQDDESAQFLMLILSTCIVRVDKTSQAQVDAITSIIEEKGRWLEKWASVCSRMYPDFEHDISPASELTLAKLAGGGIVSIDTCNVAQCMNELLIDKVKLEHEQHIESRTIEGNIVSEPEDIVEVV